MSEQAPPIEAPDAPGRINPELYINRELSWIEFNRRVLDEAKDPRNPLLGARQVRRDLFRPTLTSSS